MEKYINQINLSKIAFLLIAPFLVFVIGCNDDDNSDPIRDSNATILEVAHSRSDLSSFAVAVSKYEDLSSSLDDETQELTVFAPTDDAFDVFLDAMGYSSLDDIPDDTLKDVIQYHIISGSAFSGSEFTDGQSSATLLANETVFISINGNTIMVNASVISEADVDASNGVVHIVDAVLVPGYLGGSVASTILGVIQSNDQLSTLREAVKRFDDLLSSLNDKGESYTMFAPTNDAFEALLDVLGYASIDEVPEKTLREILHYHITSESAFLAEDFTDAQSLNTLLTDEAVTIYVNGGTVTVNSSSVISADVQVSNGVVHIIDAVLVPSFIQGEYKTVLGLAEEREELSLFVESVLKYPDLKAMLGGITANYTVFAPTNQGFETLLNITNQNELADFPDHILKKFLQYHIAVETFSSSDFTVGQSIPTLLANEKISVNPDTKNGSEYLIDKSQITEADMEADNGILHIVTGFLFPSSEARVVNTILEPVYFNRDFNILNEAIIKAGLFDAFIKKNAEYTFFAPNNNGFEKVGITNLDDFTSDSLATILQYHVHSDSAYLESSLIEAGSLSTASGDLGFSSSGDGTLVNGTSKIIRSDMINDNGITHIIDEALIP